MQEWVVGLSESRRTLYVGDRKLITGCTSFAVHNEFLVFTTDTHTCRFLPLDSDPSGTTFTVHIIICVLVHVYLPVVQITPSVTAKYMQPLPAYYRGASCAQYVAFSFESMADKNTNVCNVVNKVGEVYS